MMDAEKIKTAEAEAKRFLARFATWRKAQCTYEGHSGQRFSIGTPKQSAALRRASLDLTRALAEMRKP